MLCLRVHQGLPVHGGDASWLRAQGSRAAQFFANDLTGHFKAEEEVLFPAMRTLEGAAELLDELVSEHRELERLAERFEVSDFEEVARTLGRFADLLETHIRKEERQLFPLYEDQTAEDLAANVRSAIQAVIGDALQPRDLELLK
jgi:iron-sulfur cluster repair protein YtfE (RIC family)